MKNYIEQFSALHTNTQKGVKAPHSERLEQQFQHNWSRYVGQSDVFQPRVGTPFWHLNNEPFWRLVPYEGGDEAVAMHLQGNPYATGTTRKLIRYAEIDNELFELLQQETNRAKLRVTLIKHCL